MFAPTFCCWHALTRLFEGLVNRVKLFGFFGQLKTNVFCSHKDALQVHPLALYGIPHVECFVHTIESTLPTSNLVEREIKEYFSNVIKYIWLIAKIRKTPCAGEYFILYALRMLILKVHLDK